MLSTVPAHRKHLKATLNPPREIRLFPLGRKKHKGGVGKGLKFTSAAGAVAWAVPKWETEAQSLHRSTNEQPYIFPSTLHPLKPQVFFPLFFFTLMFQIRKNFSCNMYGWHHSHQTGALVLFSQIPAHRAFRLCIL